MQGYAFQIAIILSYFKLYIHMYIYTYVCMICVNMCVCACVCVCEISKYDSDYAALEMKP